MARTKEIKDISDQLRHADQLKLRFFTNISHEFRTPLTLILGPLSQLMEAPDVPNQQKSTLHIISKNANRLLDLVNQLLDIRKVDNNSYPLKVCKGNLLSAVTEVAERFRLQAENKSITFSVTGNRNEVPMWFDHEIIEKVMYNLLSNAFKFTAKDDKIEISISYHDAIAKLVVHDTGVGIEDDKLSLIFDRFFQSNTADSTVQSSGIGLALVKELVELHHGQITVKSNAQKSAGTTGTTFTVSLPVSEDKYLEHEKVITYNAPRVLVTDVDDTELDYRSSSSPIPQNNTIKVLIVEDHADLRHFLEGCLIQDFQVEIAENGEIGWEKTLTFTPDLILSDVMMPVLSGIELLQRIKEHELTSHIPIILLTAKTSIDSQIEGLTHGADDYIGKPFHQEVLIARIKNLIKSRVALRNHFFGKFDAIKNLNEDLSIDDKFLQRAVEIVLHNMSDINFDNPSFVKAMGMSRTKLYTKIKDLTGLTVSEFIRNTRLKYATELLKDPNKSVSEVCYASGFKYPSYFTKCFQDAFDMSPKEYQRQNRITANA